MTLSKISRFFAPACTLVCLLALLVTPARAHANLAQSVPSANAVLEQPPSEIRLWFTEPLEPQFSRITLRDSSGNRVETPPAQVDPAAPMQLFTPIADLPHGVYTIVWRVVSAADGHTTEGSIPFAIGTAVAPAAESAALLDSAPAESVLIRWFNLLSIALVTGGIGFWLLSWRPAVPTAQPQSERRLRRLMALGWLLVGLSGLLILLHHVALVADLPLSSALTDPALIAVLTDTRFGALWIIRLILWLLLGGLLWFAARASRLYWPAFAVCGLIILAHSLYSHASAAQDATAAAAGDWLHMLATALWVGGLVAFALVLRPLWRAEGVQAVSRLIACFSNYARVCVAALIISGIYAAWLHVGTLDALLTTLYGQSLLIKLILFLPLLATAGFNLLITARGLRQGRDVWVGRLRGLIAVELALTLNILAAVGVMTSTNPARGVVAVRDATPPTLSANPYFEMQVSGGVMAHLEFTPGYVGENTFIVTLFDMDNGSPIDDASLIRLRFTNTAGAYAESELRPQPQGNGVYTITGANLSAPGTWRVRMNIQRPGFYDTVLDFEPSVELAPTPPALLIDASIPILPRLTAALLAGLALIAGGAFFLVQSRPRSSSGAVTGAVASTVARAVSLSVLLVGVVFLFTALTIPA